jgi:hypothetical protein
VSARPALRDRVLQALPLAALYLVLCSLYAWQAADHLTPTIFSDELELAAHSRHIAETGSAGLRGEDTGGFPGVYAVLLAPVWWIDDVQTAYEAAKLVGVLLMTSALFPAYALARMVVSRRWALFAAAGSVATPALAYSPVLMEEPLAYPVSTLALLLIARYVARPWLGTFAAAAAAALVAPLVRGQLVVVPAILLICALVVAWRTPRVSAWRSTWTRWDWVGAVVLVSGAAVALSAAIGHQSQPWYVTTGFFKERLFEYGFRAAGALAIGVGILPFVAGLASLAHRGWNDRTRALAVTSASAIACFGLYAAVKAAYLSTVFANRTVERNVIYLVPLLFAGTALLLEQRRVRAWAVAPAALLALYLLTSTPYELATYPYGDAPSLSILALGNREFAWDDAAVERALVLALLAAVALIAAALLLRGRIAVAVTVVAAAAVLGWSTTAEVYAARGYNASAQQLYSTLPTPPDWLDETIGDDRAVYVGQAIGDANPLWLLEFWNRSLEKVWSMDGTAPGPGPTQSPDLADADGTLAPNPELPWAVAEPDVQLVAEKAGDAVGGLQLYRLDGPLRIASSLSGVSADGWMSSNVSFTQHAVPPGVSERGFVKVVLSRSGWCGEDVPGNVEVRVGSVVPRRNQPAFGEVRAVREGVLNSCEQLTFLVPVTVPFRVEATISPTFVPAKLDERLSDLRELGAQPSFTYVPLP